MPSIMEATKAGVPFVEDFHPAVERIVLLVLNCLSCRAKGQKGAWIDRTEGEGRRIILQIEGRLGNR
jgi:hypothetical protein